MRDVRKYYWDMSGMWYILPSLVKLVLIKCSDSAFLPTHLYILQFVGDMLVQGTAQCHVILWRA